ncbi:MAG: peptidase S10 [Rudaea sp.]|uniref:S10 family peptidase n=1 Tax=Rudaea sp. TaxID=2136325 RepID=UPI0039E2441D
MRSLRSVLVLSALLAFSAGAFADDEPAKDAKPDAKKEQPAAAKPNKLVPKQSESEGSVTIGGKTIDYKAVAGTLILDDKKGEGTASIFYAAYFKKGVEASKRPVMFIYNGGPGSSTVWLHMGAFGPRRVVTADDERTPAAPYGLVNNEYSLLDVADLVFIDAPGAGFSTFADKEKGPKEYFGVDPDAQAFAQFIGKFLSKYGRWNSPKYLCGESYGTTRSALLANVLQNEKAIDVNGVILISQVLNMAMLIDFPQINPGVDLSYQLVLPSYAATAWYHKKSPNPPADLQTLLREVEGFAMGEYAQALAAGTALDPARKHAVAEKLHAYTGLPVDYIERADLRVNGGEFQHTLQIDRGLTTGRLDSRFSGPALDQLAQSAGYDPQSAAISSAYYGAFNDYVRKQLKFGQDQTYELFAEGSQAWKFEHKQPGGDFAVPGFPNVMPDLAAAMKQNPRLHVMLNSGYYDLATPYYTADYEMRHLPIPTNLAGNIETHYYESGHMVYAHLPALEKLHANVAAFVQKTDNLGK